MGYLLDHNPPLLAAPVLALRMDLVHLALSDEFTSRDTIPVTPTKGHDLISQEPNKYCVSGYWLIYQDFKMLNEIEKMAHLFTKEHKELTCSP